MNKYQKIGCLLALLSQPALATDWVTTYTEANKARFNGATGSITFNDWGYTGPSGVGAGDYQVGSGFDSSRIGQIQQVTTVAADGLTSDPASARVWADVTNNPIYKNANMDGAVNFYRWGYTTPTSNFYNMQIDKAGNYHVAKNDMQFGFYDTFNYSDVTGVNPSEAVDTTINFQPYAISDAKGWCGSTLVANPNGLEVMAGQVTFDFAFDAYLNNQPSGTTDKPATQIVPGFVMRSYGDYSVSVKLTPTYTQTYAGSAVGNNMDPTSIVKGVGGTLDADFQNKVSFLGAGVVPTGVWVFNIGTRDVTVADDQAVMGTSVGEVRASDGAVWHVNAFAGYAFLLRADAGRTLQWISPTGHSDYITTAAAAYASLPAAVPVPAAAWLLGSGLIGLVGVARRKQAA